MSLVTDPTTATILELNLLFPYGTFSLADESILVNFEIEIGYLLSLDWLSLFRTTELNLDYVLLAKKEYNWINKNLLWLRF